MKNDLIYGELFRAILSNLPVIYYAVDDNNQILELSGKGIESFQADPGDMQGQSLLEVFPSIENKLNLARQYGDYFFESSNLFDKEDIWFFHYLFRPEQENLLTGIALDVSGMKGTHQALLDLGAEKRRLARRMLQIEEDIRHKIASDLHDEIGQSITAINAVASSMLHKKDGEANYYIDQAETIVNIADHMYATTHDLIYQLRPVSLDTLGLEASLQSCIQSSRLEQSGVKVELEVLGRVDSVDNLVELTIYRVIQEALTNIAKHAEASSVKITVRRKSGNGNLGADILDIIILDDGKGFDSDIRTGLGLVNLQERVQALGGVINIVSEPGNGVNIHARINLTGYRKSVEMDE